ncbi:hypothetical protein DOI34_25780 [Salmonella enterica subsp. enterica serovar Virchow]|nr:hypothetical protein [Salmonella enterica subsp. enterica serovar Virchow]EBW2353229.1 hypothetical protein [Salmonella enterica subsp. enterica serovar Enteritidis]ECB6741108.1 hypothetical protein [Salmonella enterica subsp. enterica serovar Panama]ECF1136019.1 hypothetical protein [Salmonella enterica subsp. enterica serovar Goldcoast]MIL09163.1 hypothetical protein [Salmonella enterica subsp. enterica serovar Enteritidis]
MSFRTFVFALLLAICGAAPGYAQPLLTITRTDGTVQELSLDDLKAVGEVTMRTPLFAHPADSGSPEVRTVKGPLLRDLLKRYNVTGRTARATALDAYQIDIPVEDLTAYNVVLATEIDGKQLSIRDLGPLWVVYPLGEHPELRTPVFESRSIWQVNALQMLE